MNTKRYMSLTFALTLTAFHAVAVGQTAVGTAFTYQGRLEAGGSPVDGQSCDFEFSLWDDEATPPGAQVGNSPQSASGVSVEDGLFTVQVDFGRDAWDGDARWLEIGVCCPSPCGGPGAYTTLSPRQELTPAPYSLRAATGVGGPDALNVATNGNVGIGTNAPQAELDLRGTLRIATAAGVAGVLKRETDVLAIRAAESGASPSHGAVFIGLNGNPRSVILRAATSDASSAIIIENNAEGRIAYFRADGNVGIGTTNPQTPFALRGPGGTHDVGITQGQIGAGGTMELTTADAADNQATRLLLRGDVDAADIEFYSGARASESQTMIIKASGDVGIGTPTPTTALEVAGTVTAVAFAGDGSGLTGLPSGADAWALTGNAGTTPGTHFLGTTDNQALELHVNNGRAMRLEPTGGSPNLIGGHSGNNASPDVEGAAIGGGGQLTQTNRVTDNYGTVGGGRDNQAGDALLTTSNATFATVGGGFSNEATAYTAVVAGGYDNTASGLASTVPGGTGNTAEGDRSFAAGRQAHANHVGSFVWSDSTTVFPDFFASTGDNQFLIRASGGVGIGTNIPTERLDVVGNIHASGTIASGSSITIDGTSGSESVASSNDLEFHVSSGRALRIESHAASPNLVGGFSGNSITSGVKGATISGGGESANANRVTDDFGTVGGGWDNQAGNDAGTFGDASNATVSGGEDNAATGQFSTVGGGWRNDATGGSSTIGGGSGNDASDSHATVGGGNGNGADGMYSTVPGGAGNWADGDYSFAAGKRAKAIYNGCFVWGDSTDADVTSERTNQFRVRAGGGARFDDGADWVNIRRTAANLIDTSTGARLTSGGTWANASARELKENNTPIDGRDVLTRLSELPISSWNYKVEDEGVRHIGPMAEDFRAAFGVGDSDKSIGTIDADGVALAAIQGLHQIVDEKDASLAELQEMNVAQQDRIKELETRLAAIEKLIRQVDADRKGGAR